MSCILVHYIPGAQNYELYITHKCFMTVSRLPPIITHYMRVRNTEN